MSETTIAVLGLGYVGCVTAACLSDLGHRVIGVDPDAYKVDCVTKARAPFYEPGLEDVIVRNLASGRLTATVDLSSAIAGAQVAMICVGTPSERNGNLGLGQLRQVCREVAALLPNRVEPLIIAIRSTVFPGTAEDILASEFAHDPRIRIVSNPEFLREGTAVKDFVEPSIVVVGGEDAAARQAVADLYGALGAEPSLVSLRTAEIIKYACNCFHAVKIAFANEVGALCEQMGIPAQEVMDTFCRDTRLNISSAYLRPGFAFGGSCLPKDLRALVYRAGRLDMNVPLLESILESNQEHLNRTIRAVLDTPGRIGIFGLAFKENTDDLRESPVVHLLEQLLGKGREVRVFDPHIKLDDIYGSNQRFIMNAIPHIGRLMESDFDRMLAWADCVVVTQRPSARYAEILEKSGVPQIASFQAALKAATVA